MFFESCDKAASSAQLNFQNDTPKYLIVTQMFLSNEAIARSVILEKQFHIKPCAALLSCFSPAEEAEVYDCFNRKVDSLMSSQLKLDFNKKLEQKVDSFLKCVTTKELHERYGYF